MTCIIDLTHTFHDGMPGFRMKDSSGNRTVYSAKVETFLSHEDSRKFYDDKASFEITQVTFQTSIGTYLDAPCHRYKGRKDISDIPIRDLIMDAVVIDVSHRTPNDPVTVADLPGGDCGAFEREGNVTGKAILFHFGWDQHWGKEEYFVYPFISREVIATLVRAKVGAVGVDTINIDSSGDPERPAHTQLLGNDIHVIENLCNLKDLMAQGSTSKLKFFAMPLPVKGAAAFPVRAFVEVEAIGGASDEGVESNKRQRSDQGNGAGGGGAAGTIVAHAHITEAQVDRGLAYPFARPTNPAHAFAFINGQCLYLPTDHNTEDWGRAAISDEECDLTGIKVSDPWGGPKHLTAMDALLRLGIEQSEARSLLTGRRTAVLACGSNAAPTQLVRKFSGMPAFIPVLPCTLANYDCAHAPLISSYGSVTATVVDAPGCVVQAYVTFLSDEEMERMHKTEGGYYYARLNTRTKTDPDTDEQCQGSGCQLVLADGVTQTLASPLFAYLCQGGALSTKDGDGGEPIGLAAMTAQNRPFTTMTEEQAQIFAAKKCDVDLQRSSPAETHAAVRAWVRENISSGPIRQERSRVLAKNALQACSSAQVMTTLARTHHL